MERVSCFTAQVSLQFVNESCYFALLCNEPHTEWIRPQRRSHNTVLCYKPHRETLNHLCLSQHGFIFLLWVVLWTKGWDVPNRLSFVTDHLSLSFVNLIADFNFTKTFFLATTTHCVEVLKRYAWHFLLIVNKSCFLIKRMTYPLNSDISLQDFCLTDWSHGCRTSLPLFK